MRKALESVPELRDVQQLGFLAQGCQGDVLNGKYNNEEYVYLPDSAVLSAFQGGSKEVPQTV